MKNTPILKIIIFTLITTTTKNANILQKNKIHILEAKAFRDLTTPLPFLNFLLSSPINKNTELFTNPSEIRKLEQNPFNKEAAEEGQDINSLVQTSQLFRQFEDKTEKQECRMTLKYKFIPKVENKENLLAGLENVPLIIKNSCKNIKKTCCIKEDFIFLKAETDKIITFYKKNYSFLKKIVKIFRNLTKDKIKDYVSEHKNKFRSCNPRITSDKFIEDFMNLKSNIHTIEIEYTNYMENRIKELMNLNCGFCDFKNINFLRAAVKQNLFYLRLTTPKEIKFYYRIIREFEKFIPLIAFSNMIQCLDKIDFSKDPNSRNMNFKYIKTGIMEKLDIFRIDQIVNKSEIISFFDKNYVPGTFESPLFQNVFLRLILLKNDYENDNYDKFGFVQNDKIFSKTFFGLRTLPGEVMELKPKNLVVRYSDEGYSNSLFVFNDKKVLNELEMVSVYKGKKGFLDLVMGVFAFLVFF